MITHTLMSCHAVFSYRVINQALGSSRVTNTSTTTFLFDYPCDDLSKCTPYQVVFPPGRYRIELWGAQGGDSRIQNTDNIRLDSGAKGAYVSGDIHITRTKAMYLYIGGRGENQWSTVQALSKGGYNGGGNGGVDLCDGTYPESGSGGGGATDLRLIPAENDELASLKSRIIVAAGGAGSSSADNYYQYNNYNGYDGGTLNGNGNGTICIAGTQTTGIFGKGGNGLNFSSKDFQYGGSTAGSGAGYYGGYTQKAINTIIEAGGAGGSSYISGHTDCNSVANDSSDPPKHTGSKYHYSSFYFTNTSMKQKGTSGFLSPSGKSESGHYGNGAAKITILSSEASCPMKGPYRGRSEKYAFISIVLSW